MSQLDRVVGKILGDFLEEKTCWAQACWCGGV